MKKTIESVFKRLEKVVGDKEIPLGYNIDPQGIVEPLFDKELEDHFKNLDEDTLDIIIDTLKFHLLGNESYDYFFAEPILQNKNLTYQQFKRICHYALFAVDQQPQVDWYTFDQLVSHPHFADLKEFDKMMALSISGILGRSRLHKLNQNAKK